MAPDDPEAGVRELRFRYEKDDTVVHVIVIANTDGTGNVSVIGNFHEVKVAPSEAKEAVKASLRLTSIARHWIFEEFKRLGGTVEELRAAAEDVAE